MPVAPDWVQSLLKTANQIAGWLFLILTPRRELISALFSLDLFLREILDISA